MFFIIELFFPTSNWKQNRRGAIDLNKQNVLFSLYCNQKEEFQCVSVCVKESVCFKVRVGFFPMWSVENRHQV